MPRGTLGPIRLSLGDDAPLEVGTDYFLVQVVAAQALISQGLIERWFYPARHVVVTSEVSLDAGAERLKLEGLQATRPISSGEGALMAIERNIIHLSPARAASFRLVFTYWMTTDDRIGQFGNLVRDDPAMRVAFGLAPAQIAVAQAVSGLVGKVLNVFLQREERQPLLQFEGDFNLAAGTVLPGRHAFISNAGTPEVSLALDPNKLSFKDKRLHYQERTIDHLSYAVLSIERVPVRGPNASPESRWYGKLQQARQLGTRAESLRNTPKELEKLRTEIRELIEGAQKLLHEDKRYHDWEAELIIKDAILLAQEQLTKGETTPLTEKLGAAEDAKREWIKQFNFEPSTEFIQSVEAYRQRCARVHSAAA